jgi:hypothetical protein
MIFDNRYPHMLPVDRPLPGLDAMERHAVRAFSRAVETRTGTSGYYNRKTGQVLFVYGDEPHGGPAAYQVRHLGRPIRLPDTGEIDSLVLYIQQGKMARREKDRIAERNKRHEDGKRDEAQQKFLAERRPSATDYADFLDKKRRGTTKLVAV